MVERCRRGAHRCPQGAPPWKPARQASSRQRAPAWPRASPHSSASPTPKLGAYRARTRRRRVRGWQSSKPPQSWRRRRPWVTQSAPKAAHLIQARWHEGCVFTVLIKWFSRRGAGSPWHAAPGPWPYRRPTNPIRHATRNQESRTRFPASRAASRPSDGERKADSSDTDTIYGVLI